MPAKCIQARVSGHVQGVFYRASTQQKAQQLVLTGWVKNCVNGDVELLAQGDDVHIAKLIDWLWQGPDAAEVSQVDWHEIECQTFKNFDVRPS